MKYFLWFLLLASLSRVAYASDNTYSWVLKQYASKNISDISAHTDGQIRGVRYIAIIANRTSPAQDVDPTAKILIFRKDKEALSIIAAIDLQDDNINGYSVTIKNDSFYLEQWFLHNGSSGMRYQFKKINNIFKMIGFDAQSQTLGCYVGLESDNCDEYEFISGNSYNFLTSSSICWQMKSHNKRELEEASQSLQKFVRPKQIVSHQMKFKPVSLPLLNGFKFSNFVLPSACFYDVKNRLEIEQVHR
jgi:hypothetical protein